MSLDYKNRLRTGYFVSPSGTSQMFTTNTLKKRGGKKLATQEIIDADISITQEQGNKTYSFPMTIYFYGDDFDTQLSSFVTLLEEHYTLDSYGVLKHPMWGDINVFPSTWDQNIELVNGVGIATIEVEFIEIFPTQYPTSATDSAAAITANADNMSSIDAATSMNVDSVSATKNIANKINSVVSVVKSGIAFVSTVEDTITEIETAINNLIDDVGTNITSLLQTVQRLINAPSTIIDNTLNKINTYASMCSDIISAIQGDSTDSDETNQKNNAVLMQTLGGYAVECLAISAVYTDYTARSETISVIDTMETALDDYNTAMASARTSGDVTEEYSGDHNFHWFLFDSIARLQARLLNQAFDLKAAKTFKLKHNSDVLTLCYKYYGAVDQDTMDYFCQTNKIKFDEFLDIPAGREIIIYV